MMAEFKFKQGDTVRIVDRWSGISDPAEYVVQDHFTEAGLGFMGGSIKMYEVKEHSSGRVALVQESMLQLIRSAPHAPTQSELADLFDYMDESARKTAIDHLLARRQELADDLRLVPAVSGSAARISIQIKDIDRQLAKYSEGADA